MRLLFIFLDGVGLGAESSENPFFFSDTPGISRLLEGQLFTANSEGYSGPLATLLGLDATLGVPGFPQSATGQASIFTGINAPAFLGRHLNGFPNEPLRRLLARKGLFRQLKRSGVHAAFANAYRPPFFDMLRRGLPGNRYSCSTLVTYYGGLPFYSLEDIKAGRALYMDITNDILKRMGFDVPLITPEEGAERLIEIGRNHEFCLFEYFLSDLAGHLGDRAEAGRVVKILDRFIGKLAALIDPRELMMIITSDHGNIEFIPNRDHTMNRVPALLVGDRKIRDSIQPALNNLTDLLPAVKKLLVRGWKT